MISKLLCVSMLIAGCGSVTPVPDGVFDIGNRVCSHLKTLGCTEGQHPRCVESFAEFHGSRMSDLRPDCILSASSVREVRACGNVTCVLE